MKQFGFTAISILVAILALALLSSLIWYYLNISENFLRVNKGQSSIAPTPSATVNQQPRKPTLLQEISFLRDGNLWLANQDGSNQRQITKDGNIQDYDWIPSTNKIAYYQVIETPSKITISAYLLNLDDHQPLVIHQRKIDLNANRGPGPDLYYSFGVSPDGTKIAYSGDLTDKGNTTIYDITSNASKEINEPGVQPIFSPDSQFLAGVYDGNVFIYSLKDSSKETVTSYPSVNQYYKSHPDLYAYYDSVHSVISWPDSNHIIYYYGNLGQGSMPDRATLHLYSVDINSKLSTNLTGSGTGMTDTYLGQSPDRKQLYFLVYKNFLTNRLGQPAGSEVATLSGYQMSQLGYNLLHETYISQKSLGTNQNKKFTLSQSSGDLPGINWKINIDGQLISYDWSYAVPTSNQQFSPTTTKFEIWEINSSGTNNHKILDNAKNPKWRYSPK